MFIVKLGKDWTQSVYKKCTVKCAVKGGGGCVIIWEIT